MLCVKTNISFAYQQEIFLGVKRNTIKAQRSQERRKYRIKIIN